MKHTTKLLCGLLAAVMLMSVLLTGCTLPKPTLPGAGNVAATYGDQEISTGEYLAYLYMNFNNIYQNYYYYAQYGMDPWDQVAKYGDEGTDLKLADYITATTKDSISRIVALDKMMKDNGLNWLEEDEKSVDEELATMEPDAFIDYGISNDSFTKAYKNMMLTEYSAFMGLYGKGGINEVKDTEIRKYFNKNYLSYKMITVNLTDDQGKALSKKDKQKQLDLLNGYLKIYNEKGFEKAMDAYNQDNAAEGEKVTASKDEENRNDMDATELDSDTVKAIRSVEVGKAKIVEYGGDDEKNPTTASLIVRLDINKPASLYKDSTESILYSLKHEEFDKEVEKVMETITVEFNDKVIKKCDPKAFAEEG